MLSIYTNSTQDGEVFLLITGRPVTEEEKALIRKMNYTFRKVCLDKHQVRIDEPHEEMSHAEY